MLYAHTAMGNPFIRSEAFQQQPSQQEESPNGILVKVPGDIIGSGSQQLPRPGPDQQDNPARSVVFHNVRDLGSVRITYELASYKHGRSKHWSWRAVRADREGLSDQPPSIQPTSEPAE